MAARERPNEDAPRAAPRTVEVRSPSARTETIAVLHAAFHVALWAAVIVSLEASSASDPKAAALDTPPFVQRFDELDSTDQRMVRPSPARDGRAGSFQRDVGDGRTHLRPCGPSPHGRGSRSGCN